MFHMILLILIVPATLPLTRAHITVRGTLLWCARSIPMYSERSAGTSIKSPRDCHDVSERDLSGGDQLGPVASSPRMLLSGNTGTLAMNLSKQAIPMLSAVADIEAKRAGATA